MSRRTAQIAGLLYLLTFVTSIPAFALKTPILDQTPGDHAVAGAFSALLEVILAVACVGTAVVLYPVIRRQNETAARGFVAARTVEAGLIGVGIIAVLAATRVTETAGLIAIHDSAFLLGPGFIPAINALCLGWALFRSGLVPRVIPLVGLIGAPLLAVSATCTLFGLFAQSSPAAAVLALPIAAWEASLGLWLTFKGFRPAAVGRLTVAAD